jgi:hypothetical protein
MEATVYQVARAVALYLSVLRNKKSVDQADILDEAKVFTDWIVEGKRVEED